MTVLVIAFVILVGATVAIACACALKTRAPAGGPQHWGRSCAAKTGRFPAATAIAVLGWLVVIAIMIPIGLASRGSKSPVDRPVFRYVSARVADTSSVTKVMSTFTIMGNRSVIELVVVFALLILGAAYGRRWWIPTVAITAVVVMQREGQVLLAHLVQRDHPPAPNAGNFPSGGVSRLVAIYGIVVVLSILLLPVGQRIWSARLWTGLAVTAAIETYTRIYLSVHWITDALSGLIFGSLILLVAVAALGALAFHLPPISDAPIARRPIFEDSATAHDRKTVQAGRSEPSSGRADVH